MLSHPHVQQQLIGSSVALVSCGMVRLQLIEKAELEAVSDQQLEVAGSVQLLPVPPHHLDLGVVIVLGKLLHCCLKIDWVEGEGMSVGASVTGEGLPESSPLAFITWAKAYKANRRLGDKRKSRTNHQILWFTLVTSHPSLPADMYILVGLPLVSRATPPGPPWSPVPQVDSAT